MKGASSAPRLSTIEFISKNNEKLLQNKNPRGYLPQTIEQWPPDPAGPLPAFRVSEGGGGGPPTSGVYPVGGGDGSRGRSLIRPRPPGSAPPGLPLFRPPSPPTGIKTLRGRERNGAENISYYNFNDFLTMCNDSIWKIYRIVARFFFRKIYVVYVHVS